MVKKKKKIKPVVKNPKSKGVAGYAKGFKRKEPLLQSGPAVEKIIKPIDKNIATKADVSLGNLMKSNNTMRQRVRMK